MPAKITVNSLNVQTTTIDFMQSDLDWQTNISAPVNKILADDFSAYTNGGGDADPTQGAMTVTNFSKTEGGGGLVSKSWKFQPTADGTPMYFAQDWKLFISSAQWKKIMRLELDLKILLGDASKITPTPAWELNGSNQLNPDTGYWQCDPDSKGWVNAFKPLTPILLDQVSEIRHRWSWNGKLDASGRWSHLAMAQNDEQFVYPANFQNLPLIAEPWGGPLVHPQIQTELKGAPATHAFSVIRGRIIISTQPIPLSLPWPSGS